jgi:diguanylate cyclase (GGDEF)-like protein/PAS domain S-box-containing protein
MDRTQPRERANGATDGRTRPDAQVETTAVDGVAAPAASDVRVVLDALPQPAFIVSIGADEVFRFVHANARYRALFGLDHESDLGDDLRAVLTSDVLVPHVTAFARASAEGESVSFDVSLEHGRRTLTVDVVQLPEDWADERRLLGVVHDVTEHKRIEALLAHRVRHDPLTELPNRVMLLEQLSDSLMRAGSRTTPRQVALVLFDLDHFKIVNDSLGLPAGDELFAVVAQRVERVLRAGDTVARLGGDELAIVCNDARGERDAVSVAERVRSVLTEPVMLESGEVFVTASIGVALSTGDHDTPERLLRDANIAMFAAKKQGRGRIEVFRESMRETAIERLELESALRRALVHEEFRVHYQPVIRFDCSEVIGFEALVRWEHPERGILTPDDFLQVAEETGLIVPIGGWVLREACDQAARWAEESNYDIPLVVSVNVSARQLADDSLLPTLIDALTNSRLDPSLLVLEITETTLMADRDHAIEMLRRINDLGVHIGIDDFGTGQSSLAYLRALPVHSLKIDSTFVDGLGRDPEGAAIVSAVVHLGHALGLSVTAEGVETTAQLEELRALGCDLGQGFYFAYPQPGPIVQALVRHRFQWRQRASVS